MRYQDWDVLLFPAGEEAAHVPVKEFRTQCYTELHDHTVTPLLTTFIPTLPRNALFQVSIHSWAKTDRLIAPAANGTITKEAWQVKVVIDGACVAAETFNIDVTWPQIMTNDNQAHQLRFPPFHRSILAQNSWNAADHMGRIRVELSSGYVDEKYGRFVKVSCHVIFAFQPGPEDVLERNGISWPNQRMYQSPLQTPSMYGGIPGGVSTIPPTKHRRVASTSNINLPPAMGGLVTPPLTATFNHGCTYPSVYDAHRLYDAGSRSTSAYSTMTDSAAPLLKKDVPLPMHFMPTQYPGTYPTPQTEAMRKAQSQFAIRLPSDQLDMIIKAIRIPHQTQHIGEPTSTMLPPPLPHHVTAPRDNIQAEHRNTLFGSTFPPVEENGSTTTANVNRREISRFSDVSMHPACASFPACTTEDSEGRIIHSADCNAASNGTGAPASVVRGRKEGSSPTKPRDFFSTILDTTAVMKSPQAQMETQSPAPALTESKKRTRSALKSLSINEVGSPEKMDVGSAVKPPRKANRADQQENIMDVA